MTSSTPEYTCPERVGKRTVTFSCYLPRGHEGPHAAVEDSASMTERAKWSEERKKPFGTVALEDYQGLPQTTAERYTVNPTPLVSPSEDPSPEEPVEPIAEVTSEPVVASNQAPFQVVKEVEAGLFEIRRSDGSTALVAPTKFEPLLRDKVWSRVDETLSRYKEVLPRLQDEGFATVLIEATVDAVMAEVRDHVSAAAAHVTDSLG